MEKLNEMLLGFLAIVGGILAKRIYSNQDALADRISALEKTIVVKEDLDPIERNIDIILTHILNSKKGE